MCRIPSPGPATVSVFVAASLMWSVPVAGQTTETQVYAEDFESGTAINWWSDPGWSVVPDGGGFVYRGDGLGHAHTGYDAGVWGDSTLKLRFRLAGDLAQVSYRHSGTDRYFLGITDTETLLHKQVGEEVFQDNLAAGPGVTYGEWHDLEVAMAEGALTVRSDGAEVLSYVDPAPLSAGGISFESFEAALSIDDVEVLVSSTAVAPEGFEWVRTGGPLGGLGYDIRMHPENPDLMYVTDAFAGVFRSTDGGATWAPINDGVTARTGESGDAVPVFCLTIDPNNPDIVWAGTQGLRGVFKSVDGGDSWEEKVNGIVEDQGITFRGITVEPGNSQVVYIAAEIASWIWNGSERLGREFDMTQGVVYKTVDGGDTWEAVWRGDNLARYVWIDPRDTEVIYVSTGIFDREAANSDPNLGIPGGEGIVKSTDGGQTWFHVNNGLDNLYVGSLYMHPENPDVLLAAAGNIQYHEGGGAYLTRDGGATWQQTLDSDILESVEFSTSDPNVAYAGSDRSLYRSTDGGATWSLATGGDEDGWGPPGVRAGFPIDFQVDPRDAKRIFTNNYGGGNFVSEDEGTTWAVASKGYTGAQTRAVALHPTSPGTVLAAARSGIFGSTSGGESWAGLSYPPTAALEWQVVAVDPDDPAHILAANNWHGTIWQSHDQAQSWQATDLLSSESLYFRTIEFAPSDSSVVYAGSAEFYSAGTFDSRLAADGVFVSRDGGATWSAANDAMSADAQIVGLAISSTDPDVVFAATGSHGVLKTINGGQSWDSLTEGLPASSAVLSVVIHPDDPGVLFAGLEMAGIYRSDDGGSTWQIAGAGMNPQASVSDIVFDPNDPAVIFASDRFSGVYRSEDGGGLWVNVSDGLRTRAVNDLAISSDGQHLYAATEGEGVYRLDVNGTPPATTASPWIADNPPVDPGDEDPVDPPDDDPGGDGPSDDGPAGGGSGGGGMCGGGAAAAMVLLIPTMLAIRVRRVRR